MGDPLTPEFVMANQRRLLEELRRRQAVVRDYVRGVALDYHTGLYLFGRPGTSKTHLVRSVLGEEIRLPYHHHHGHLTPMGLFSLLAEYPEHVIVLDDVSSIFRGEVGLQVLLSALEPPGDPGRVRVVRYRRQGGEQVVLFRGGIICISNRRLHDDELLNAFKSRVHVLDYEPSDAQIGALMLDIAGRGWPAEAPSVSPEQARDVAVFVMRESVRLGCRFDLRLYVDKALPDYQQFKDGETDSDWRDLVTASAEEQMVAPRHADEMPANREARKEGEQAVVREIVEQHTGRRERVNAWIARTGKSERAFYRRLAEIR